MILSRAWLHDTVSCAAWNDARKGVYLKPLFKTPCSNCYWGWSKTIMLDYRDISLMESVPLLWRTVTASPVGIEPMTILEDNWYLIHNVENSTFSTGWPPNTPYDCAEARRTQVADATFRDLYENRRTSWKTLPTFALLRVTSSFDQKSPRPSYGFRLQWIPLAALLLSEEHETKVYSVGWIARALTLFLDGNQKRTPKK